MKHTSIAAEIRTTIKEHGVLSYGDQVIHYEIIRRVSTGKVETKELKASKSKVTIKVHPDQRVVATVPNNSSAESIQEAMLKRARWIWKNLQEFANQQYYVLPKTYVSGETQFYLGRRYVLKILSDSSEVPYVKLLRGKLEVCLKQQKADKAKQVKAMIDQWYAQRAKHIFYERLHAMLHKATWVKGIPSFRIMAMKKQWGSCSTKGSLMLNPHLVKAPKECIDYVILHELCHIEEHNHSEKFWRLLTQVMPNWKEVKAKLDDMAELYLNE